MPYHMTLYDIASCMIHHVTIDLSVQHILHDTMNIFNTFWQNVFMTSATFKTPELLGFPSLHGLTAQDMGDRIHRSRRISSVLVASARCGWFPCWRAIDLVTIPKDHYSVMGKRICSPWIFVKLVKQHAFGYCLRLPTGSAC